MRRIVASSGRTPLRLAVVLGVGALVLVAGLSAGCSLLGDDGGTEEIAGWPPPAAVVDLGRAAYEANCAVCHGQNGEGAPNWQEQTAGGVYPAPPHDSSGHTWHHADGLLFEIVRDGGSQFDTASFRSGMPAWGGVLTDGEIRAVITYLKTFWGPEERAFQFEVSEQDRFPSD